MDLHILYICRKVTKIMKVNKLFSYCKKGKTKGKKTHYRVNSQFNATIQRSISLLNPFGVAGAYPSYCSVKTVPQNRSSVCYRVNATI